MNALTSYPYRAVLLAGGIALAAAAAGCMDARVTNVWRDPDFDTGSIHSLLVVSQEASDVDRRLWEDAVGQGLAAHGVEALPSYRSSAEAAPGKAAMAGILDDEKLDGALVLRPLRGENESHWVPGTTSYEPQTRYDPWARRAPVTVWRPRHTPGYREIDRIERTQATLWARDTGGTPRMVWAATGESTNPSSADELRRDVTSGVFPALERAGVLRAGRRGRGSRD